MRLHHTLVPSLLALALLGGCEASDGAMADEEMNDAGGKSDDFDEVDDDDVGEDAEAWEAEWEAIEDSDKVPLAVYLFMHSHDWGTYHFNYHAARRWLGLSAEWKGRLADEGVDPNGMFQEGSYGSGVDFCTMHSGMFAEMMEQFPQLGYRDWASDGAMNAAMDSRLTEEQFADYRASVDALGDFDRFLNADDPDDAMCRLMETNLVLKDPNRPAPTNGEGNFGSFFRSDTRVGLGVHNDIHSWMADSDSKVNMGSNRVNLYNQNFWRLHGWVEWCWREARAEWYPECGDGFGVPWNPAWDLLEEEERRAEVIENCGGEAYYELSVKHRSHRGGPGAGH